VVGIEDPAGGSCPGKHVLDGDLGVTGVADQLQDGALQPGLLIAGHHILREGVAPARQRPVAVRADCKPRGAVRREALHVLETIMSLVCTPVSVIRYAVVHHEPEIFPIVLAALGLRGLPGNRVLGRDAPDRDQGWFLKVPAGIIREWTQTSLESRVCPRAGTSFHPSSSPSTNASGSFAGWPRP